MALQDSGRRSPVYVGTGQVREFAFNFKVFSKDEISVYTQANGSDTAVLLDPARYSVELFDVGGTITLQAETEEQNQYAALPEGDKLVIVSNIPYTQDLGLNDFGAFSPSKLTGAWDKNTALIQQVKDKVDRAVTVSELSEQTPQEFVDALFKASEDAEQAAERAEASAQEAADKAEEVKSYSYDIPRVVDSLDVLAKGPDGLYALTGMGDTGEQGEDISNRVVKATGSTELRALGERFADVVNVKDFGAKGDGVTDDTAAIKSAARKGTCFFPFGTYLFTPQAGDEALLGALVGESLFCGRLEIKIPAGTTTLGDVVVTGGGSDKVTFSGVKVGDTQVLGVSPSGDSSFVLSVQSSAGFTPGAYALLSRDSYCLGVFKIESVYGDTVTAVGSAPEYEDGMCVIPLVSVVETQGIEICASVGAIENIAFVSTGAYCLDIGAGRYNDDRTYKKAVCASITNAAFINGYDAGIRISGSGSHLAFKNVAISSLGIGLAVTYSASVKGTGLCVYSPGDCVKIEHASDGYVSYARLTSSSEACVASRYASAAELAYASLYSGDTHGIAQFSSYLSVRESITRGEKDGFKALDSSSVVTSNVTTDGSSEGVGILCERASSFRTIENCNFDGYAVLFQSTFSTVAYNGIKYAGGNLRKSITVGSVGGGIRAAYTTAVSGVTKEKTNQLSLTVLSDIPNGIIPTATIQADGVVRIIFQNATQSAVNVGTVDVVLAWV